MLAVEVRVAVLGGEETPFPGTANPNPKGPAAERQGRGDSRSQISYFSSKKVMPNFYLSSKLECHPMTARMAVPSQRAQRRASTEPGVKTKRGADKGQGLTARARGTDTSNLSAEEMAEVISPDKPLTEKQRLFVQYWAQGDSIPGASRRAGYNDSAAVAYRMVKMPNILKLKAKYEAEWEESGKMTRQRVMDGMLESIEMAKLMAEPATMVSGWREIGKLCGYYAPVEHKVKIDVTGNVIVDRLNSMSDAELLKIISQGPAAMLSDI